MGDATDATSPGDDGGDGSSPMGDATMPADAGDAASSTPDAAEAAAPLDSGHDSAVASDAGDGGTAADANDGAALDGGSDGASAARLTISPSTLQTFPNTSSGQISSAIAFTVTNAGGSTSSSIQASTTPDDFDFAVVTGNDMCTGVTLAPNATCTFQVVFLPQQAGMTLSSSAQAAATSGGTASCPITGTSN